MTQRKHDPKRRCANKACGKLLARKRYGSRLEDLSIFRRRKYCDLLCFAEDHTK